MQLNGLLNAAASMNLRAVMVTFRTWEYRYLVRFQQKFISSSIDLLLFSCAVFMVNLGLAHVL